MKFTITLLSVLCTFVAYTSAQWSKLERPYGRGVYLSTIIDSVLIVRADDREIYRSTDNGESWKQISSEIQHHNSLWIARMGKTIIGVTEEAIYTSTDNGENWKRIQELNGKSFTYLQVIGTTIFGVYDGYLSYTNDLGKTWTKIIIPKPDNTMFSSPSITFLTVKDSDIYLGTFYWGLYRIYKEDTTLKIVNCNFPYLNVLSFSSIGSTIFVGTLLNGIYKGVSGGYVWTHFSDTLLGKRANSMGVSDSTLLASIDSAVYRTTDIGKSWTKLNIGFTKQKVRMFFTYHKTFFAAIEDFGLMKSIDNGDTWTIANTGLNCGNPMYVITKGDTLFAGSNGGGIYRSTDNGISWKDINSGLTDLHVLKLVAHGSFLFAYSTGYGIFRSSDNGDNWIMVNSGIEARSYISGLMFVDTVLFASTLKGNVGSIYKSTDNGDNWVLVDENYGNTSLQFITLSAIGKVLFKNRNDYIKPALNGIFRSTDYGNTWVYVNKGLPDSTSYTIVSVGSYLFSSTISGRLFRSSDLGETWLESNTGQQRFDISSMISDGTKLIAATTTKGAFKSTDNGLNWSHLSSSESDSTVSIISLAINNGTLFAGTNKFGIWKYDLNSLAVSESNNNMNREAHLFCYPNPTTNTLTIDRTSLQFPENKPVHYSLSTLIGGKVMEFDNSELKFTVSLVGMASGVYSLTAECGVKKAAVMVTVVE